MLSENSNPHIKPLSIHQLKGQKNFNKWALGLGIFILPFIFSWATLAKSYDFKVKTAAFGWLTLYLIGALWGGYRFTMVPRQDVKTVMPIVTPADPDLIPPPEKPSLKVTRADILEPFSSQVNGFQFKEGPDINGLPHFVGQKGSTTVQLIGPAENLIRATLSTIFDDDQKSNLKNAYYILDFSKAIDARSVTWITKEIKVLSKAKDNMHREKAFGHRLFALKLEPMKDQNHRSLVLTVLPK